MKKSNFFVPLIRSAITGIVAVAVSLPLLWALHRSFGLGKPPLNGIVVLGLGVILAFVGAAAIGILTARSMPDRRAKTGWWAALFGLVWGIALVSVLVPTYAGMVADEIAKEGAMMALRSRGELLEGARDTLSQIQNGKSGDAARGIGAGGLQKAKELAISGAARLPALSLLFWAILAPPFIAFLEARAAKR